MHYKKPVATEKPVCMTPDQVKMTVSFLNRSFREAADEFKKRTGLNSNVRGSILNGYQVDFAYLIDKIQRGPIFLAIQHTAEANELIGKLQKQQKV